MTESLTPDLSVLAKKLTVIEFSADNARTRQGRAWVKQALERLESHLVAREKDLDAPLVAVLAGSTGAGKSSLLNTLVGQDVAEVSVRRPTTSRPLLLHHPDDELWFAAGRILGNFERIRISPEEQATPAKHVADAAAAQKPQLEIRANENMVRSVALIDAPDLDSLQTNHQKQAQALLEAADLWIFVTTAARYGDAVPWHFLEQAAQRNLVVAVVLNRVPTGALLEVKQDLAQRLAKLGLVDVPLFTIREDKDKPAAFLPEHSTEAIKQWLQTLSADALMRSAIARQSLVGSVHSTLELCQQIAQVLKDEDQVLQRARLQISQAQERADQQLEKVISQGNLLHGEVVGRWQELLGTSDLLKGAQNLGQRLLAGLERFWQGALPSVEPVEKAVGHSVSAALVVQLEQFFEQVQSSWQDDDETAYLAAQWKKPSSDELLAQAQEITAAWQRSIIDMLRNQGAEKNRIARRLALGINAIAIALMLVIFASTGGLTGLEVGVAGGSAVVAQKMLELLFGQQAINSMVKSARKDLQERFAKWNQNYAEQMRQLLGEDTGSVQAKQLLELVEQLGQQWRN